MSAFPQSQDELPASNQASHNLTQKDYMCSGASQKSRPAPERRSARHGRRVRRKTRAAIEHWLEGQGIRLERVEDASVPMFGGGVGYRWVTHRPGQLPRAYGTLYRSLRAIDDHWAIMLIRYYWHRQTWVFACSALAEGDASMPDNLSRWLAGHGEAGVPDPLVRAFGWATLESIDVSPGAPVYLELPDGWQAMGLEICNGEEGLPRTYEEFQLRDLLAEEIKLAEQRHFDSLPCAAAEPAPRRRL